MTEPDEALLWAIESWGADKARRLALPEAEIEAGVARADALLPDHDGMDQVVVLNRAHAHRVGQAASAERIKALEEENAALQEMAGNLQVQMSDMLTRLEERYPEDFVWLKEADQ